MITRPTPRDWTMLVLAWVFICLAIFGGSYIIAITLMGQL